MRLLNRLSRKSGEPGFITIVSGLPRSGTSMMMKMLAAGGLPLLSDEVRQADANNPKGYHEFERVKKLPDGDNTWLASATGKAVKVVSPLLPFLAPEHSYRVIFMHRSMEEILASQRSMLMRAGKLDEEEDEEEVVAAFRKHLAKTEAWLAGQANMRVLHVDYNELMGGALHQLEAINRFLGGNLDVAQMATAIDVSLYRQRS